MVNPNRFYTYAYLREDRTPYYIGKGSGNRINDNSGKPCNKPKDKSRVIFLKQNLTEEEAFKHEEYMVAVFGRKDLGTGILHNRSDGGDGPSGWVPSEETRRKMSEARKGKYNGEDNPFYGKSHTKQNREKISEANKGENHHCYGKSRPEETRRKISEARKGENNPFYGKSHTEETRKKQSEIMKGNKYSLGFNHTEESRKKMSEARKGLKWWNDGQIEKRSREHPGDGWERGRIGWKKEE